MSPTVGSTRVKFWLAGNSIVPLTSSATAINKYK